MAYIEISNERCKGCGLCVENCPQKLIVIGQNRNADGYFIAEYNDNEMKCRGCQICFDTCPDVAIVVFK